MNQLWIMGKYVAEDSNGNIAWEFMGVFDSEDAAVAACTEWEHFIGPGMLNERLSDETVPWDGLYYPIAKAQGAYEQ